MSNPFQSILARIAVRAEKLDGDYYKDGLLYCGKCNTPKECVINFEGIPEPKTVRTACKCVKEQQLREEAEEKIARRRESINESLKGLIEIGAGRMPKFNFSMCDDSNAEVRERMKKYALNFDKVYDKNIGLLLYGDTGTGKTFFAECIASELLKNGRFAWLTSVSGIVSAMAGNYGNNNAYIMNFVQNVDLLILDDFGTERDTSFMHEHLYNIVDARYVSKKPILITTNVDPKAMVASNDIQIKRIGERIIGSCALIEVKGKSKRIDEAKNKLAELKSIFGE